MIWHTFFIDEQCYYFIFFLSDVKIFAFLKI